MIIYKMRSRWGMDHGCSLSGWSHYHRTDIPRGTVPHPSSLAPANLSLWTDPFVRLVSKVRTVFFLVFPASGHPSCAWNTNDHWIATQLNLSQSVKASELDLVIKSSGDVWCLFLRKQPRENSSCLFGSFLGGGTMHGVCAVRLLLFECECSN